jgi:hypothetical protein
VELQCANAHTLATERNQPLWQLGDVLELFAGVKGSVPYVEYHAAPNGVILQLLWSDSAALKEFAETGDLAGFALRDDKAFSKVRQKAGSWEVYGELPASSVPGNSGKDLAGEAWEINFGRYEYSDNNETFVLSSTSPLTQPAYHRRQEWRQIVFR